jgi:hypothetical protein
MIRRPLALVINPWVMDFKLYDEWMHPLGLYFLIDLLVANGIETRFFNCLERWSSAPVKKYGTGVFTSRQIPKPDLYKDIKRHYKWYGCTPEHLREFLHSTGKPDVIFVGSMMTYWADGVVETVRTIRDVYPEVPVVCGGIAVRLMPHYFRARLPEVHLSMTPLLGADVVSFPGITPPLKVPDEWALGAGIRCAAPRYHAPALLTLGCPLQCSYCASKRLQPSFVRRDIDTVWNEISMCVHEFGISDFAFNDDARLVDAPRLLIPLLERIIANRLSIRLHTPNGLHLKYIDVPLLDRMLEAGFTTLRFGFESGLPRYHHTTAQKADTPLLEEKLSLLRQYRFPDTGVYVMGGLPGSSPSEMIEEMQLVGSFGVAVKPVFISPVPGTPLFGMYAANHPDLLDEPLWQNDSFYCTRLPGWGQEGIEAVRMQAKKINAFAGGGSGSINPTCEGEGAC